MDRIFSRIGIVLIITLVLGGLSLNNSGSVAADPIDPTQRMYLTDEIHVSSGQSESSLASGYLSFADEYGSPGEDTGYIFAHLNWTYPTSGPVIAVNSVPSGFTLVDQTSYNLNVNDTENTDIEYAFVAALYAYNTNTYEDNVSFGFDGVFTTASMRVVPVEGVDTMTPYAPVTTNGTTVSQPETENGAISTPLAFASVAYNDGIDFAPWFETTEIPTSNYDCYPCQYNVIYTQTETDDTEMPQVSIEDYSFQSVDAPYSQIAVQLNFVEFGTPQLTLDSATLEDFMLVGSGTATTSGGAFIVDDLFCDVWDPNLSQYVNMSNCATPDDGTYDSAFEVYDISLDMTGSAAGTYSLELLFDEYNTASGNSSPTPLVELEIIMDEFGDGTVELLGGSGVFEVVIDTGPTVVGNDVTVTGHATSQGGAYNISDFEFYVNAQFVDINAEDGSFDEPIEEFTWTLNDLAVGSYTLEFYAYESDGVTTNWTIDYGGPEIRTFDILPSVVQVSLTSGPTVVGREVTVVGEATARDPAWQVTDVLYEVRNASGGAVYASGSVPATDGNYDGEQIESFTFVLDDIPNGDYLLDIWATEDDFGAGTGTSDELNLNFEIFIAPALDFTITGPTTSGTSSYVHFEGTLEDTAPYNIDRIYYTVESGPEIDILPVDGVFDESLEEFEIDAGPFFDGTFNDIRIYGVNEINSSIQETFLNTTVNNSSTAADCELSNHATPTNDTTPTHTVTCTSPDNIIKMEYRVAQEVGVFQIPWTDIPQGSLSAGSYGSTSVTASITTSAIPDGNTSFVINAYTGTGKFHTNEPENFQTGVAPAPYDVFVVEATDNSAPTIKLNPILPNPVTSTAPFITGSCQDVHPFDTNSNIATLQYRIDGGSWTTIPPLNAPLDTPIEYFSYQLPELAIDTYVLDVRCIDSAGRDTNALGGNQTLNFEIIAQPDVEPEEVIIVENFTDDSLNSINETTAIWGNGYIRLKEEIDFDKTLIDSDGFVDRYGSVFSDEFPLAGSGDNVWYAVDYGVNNYGLKRYNTLSTAITEYQNISTSRLIDVEPFSHGGIDYVLVTHGGGLALLRVDTEALTNVTYGGLPTAFYQPRGIYRDTRNANLGFYIGNAVTLGGTANTYYLDLNGTPTTLGDDTFTWYTTSPGFELDNVVRSVLDTTNNVLYLAQFGDGLIRIDDGGTPLNLGDDTRTLFDFNDFADASTISGLVVDPADDGLFITTHLNQSRLFYLDANGTPLNGADDTVTQLADTLDLLQQRIDNLVFVEGPEYVGGQLFMMTRTGKLFYYNTNGTYSQASDDTEILWETNEGLFPEYISDIYVADYNTVYGNFQHTGMSRIDLNRSWEDTGDAVTISIPPEVRLIVNNINLEDVLVGPLLEDVDGLQEPNSESVGVQYFVSIDDGVTYDELTVGELKTVLEEDYRLKLKITLTKIGLNSKTPIIEGFTLAYGAYEGPIAPEDVDSLDIVVSPTTFNTDTNFNITVRALDILGFPVASVDDVGSMQLKDFVTDANVDALTPITLDFNDGVATITTAQISQAGSYKITATHGAESVDSVQLTVNQGPLPDPDPEPGITHTLSFFTDTPTIQKGNAAILTWNTTNTVSATIQGYGSVPVNGNLSVSPEVTTTYYITAFDAEGDTLTASLTITVVDGVGSQTPVSTPLDDEGNPIPLELIVPDDYIEVLIGNPVTITWTTEGNPDSVYIDYLGRNATSSGSFEFYPDRDIVITITATRGGETITRTITIRVIDGLPNPYTPALVAATGILLTSLMTGGIAQYFSLFLGLVLFRKRRYWGVVYNASKYLPIPFVTVRVYKVTMKAKEYVAQTVTDLEGKYGIPVGIEGEYQVEFIHDGYRTEVKNLSIQQNSDIILDVGMIELDTEGMPLSSKIKIFFKENSPTIMQWLRVAIIALMLVGAYITLQVISLSPLAINYIVLVLYAVAIVTQTIVLLSPYINVKRGKVVEISSKRPVKGAVFRILGDNQKATQGVESLSFTNDYGVLKIRVAPGKYAYQVSKPGYEANTGEMRIDESGKITETIYMTKGSGGFGS